MDSSNSGTKEPLAPSEAARSASRRNESNHNSSLVVEGNSSHQESPEESRAAADGEGKEMLNREFRILQEEEENYVRYHEENAYQNGLQGLLSVHSADTLPGAFAIGGPETDTSNETTSNPASREDEENNSTVNLTEDSHVFTTSNELIEAHLVSETTEHDAELEESRESFIVEAKKLNNRSSRWTIVALVLVSVVLLVVVVSLLAVRDEGGDEDRSSSRQDGAEVENGISYPCFQSNEELRAAVHAYHQDNTPAANVSLTYGWPIGSWCVTPLEDFTHTFLVNKQDLSISEELVHNMSYFQEDIGDWDMSNALEMEEMVRGVQNLTAKWGIHRWNTSSMTSLKALFMDTHWKPEPALDLGAWDVSNVETLNQLFRWSSVSTSNISGWDTRNVRHIGQLAEEAVRFNDDISHWNTAKVVFMYQAFKGASSFQGDLSRWNTSSLVDLNWAFGRAHSFNSDISQWDVSRVGTMLGTFKDSAFNQDISSWNVTSVTELQNLFLGASSFRQDLCAWGPRLSPKAKIGGMFSKTSCPNQTDPVIPHGPFCFNCDLVHQ